MFENKPWAPSGEEKQETLGSSDSVCDKLFIKLCKEYGDELVDKVIQKELARLARDEKGNIDIQKLAQIRQKVDSDKDFAQIVYQSVGNRLRGLGAYIKKRESHELAKGVARVDTLTKLPNRRGFEDEIDKKLAQIARFKKGKGNIERCEGNFWIMMLDIDKFKVVNDTHGHDAGDAILEQLSQVMRNELRPSDFPARWGGEEFIVIVDELGGGANGVLLVAERLRKVIEDYKFTYNKKLTDSDEQEIVTVPVTVSVGIARYDGSGDVSGTRQKADAGLYIAKGETTQIEQLGIKLADGQTAPKENETRNQVWYCDNESDEYLKYSKI